VRARENLILGGRVPIAGQPPVFLLPRTVFSQRVGLHAEWAREGESSIACGFSPNLKRVLSETCVGNYCKLDFLFLWPPHTRPFTYTRRVGEQTKATRDILRNAARDCSRERVTSLWCESTAAEKVASLSCRQINLPLCAASAAADAACPPGEVIFPFISVCGKCLGPCGCGVLNWISGRKRFSLCKHNFWISLN